MPEISDVVLTLHLPMPEVFKLAQVLSGSVPGMTQLAKFLATHDPTGKRTRRSKGELYARLGRSGPKYFPVNSEPWYN
jgi:hypothetical protein